MSSITSLKHRLADIIEPDFGLLDELLRLEVLSRRQYEDIRSERRAAYRRSEAVLDLITSEQQCDKLLQALQRTQQPHVVNFVEQNGGQKLMLSVDCSSWQSTSMVVGLGLLRVYSLMILYIIMQKYFITR